jgi:hypothetical protein
MRGAQVPGARRPVRRGAVLAATLLVAVFALNASAPPGGPAAGQRMGFPRRNLVVAAAARVGWWGLPGGW